MLCECVIPIQTQANTYYKTVTHEEVGLSFLQKEQVKVFYTSGSSTQKSLAQQCLDIIYGEYETCSEILNLSIDSLNPCTLVFCDSENDPYVVECSWFAFVDEIQCWPITYENSIDFTNSINGWLLYHMLPHEIADTTLRVRNVDATYGGWFIEGVGEYVRLQCAEKLDKLNESFWLDKAREDLNILSGQKWRIVDLSNRSSFEGYGAPNSKDESVFYVGSLVFINDLVEKYGDEFIADVVANNCTSYQEIREVIEDSTGYNINNSIKNVSVGWVLEEYISLLEKLNVNITELQKLKKIRGIAVGSDIIGSESSISEILDFIDDCYINMLIVDFGWITWSWNNTQFDDVGSLINESKQRNIPTWLMYRARTLPDQYEYLQHQIHIDGEVDDRYICFTDSECKNWSITWAHRLLENYSIVDGIILYNPLFLTDGCYCPVSLEKFKNDTEITENPKEFEKGTTQYETWWNWQTKEITDFVKTWKNNIASFYPNLQFGLVVNSGGSAVASGQNLSELGAIVDMLCPFAALHSIEDAKYAGNICNEVKEITNATVIADIKIYGPYNNNDEDIINAIKSSLDSNGDGFFIWCYDSLDPAKYDIELIKTAYSTYYHDWYSSSDENFLQVYIGIVMFIIGALSIAIIFFYEKKID